MASLVLDTHAAIWYLEQSPRLSAFAQAAIRAAIAGGDPVFVSPVTVVELIYLVEKGRFRSAVLDQLLALFQLPVSGIRVTPVDLAVAKAVQTVPSTVRDMPDRIIAATAVALGLPLVTSDRQIEAAGIATVW